MKRSLINLLFRVLVPLVALIAIGCSLDTPGSEAEVTDGLMGIIFNEEGEVVELKKVEVAGSEAKGWGTCYNATGQKLIIYGPKLPGETYDNSLYVLYSGNGTPVGWDCDGYYVPIDRYYHRYNDLTYYSGPRAVKHSDFTSFTVYRTATTVLYTNKFDAGTFTSPPPNWRIPAWNQAYIESHF